jgi:hypothetical protein
MRLRRRSPVRSMRAPDLLARIPWHTFAARAPYPPPLGALIAAVSHRRTQNGHCSCSRCSGCDSPSRAIIRAEMQRMFLYRHVSKAPSLLGYCALHACYDAQGRASDCAVGPTAAAAAALISASVVRGRAGPAVAVCALPTHAAHARRTSCGTFTLDRLDRCIDSAAACSPPSWSPLMRHEHQHQHRAASTA